MTPMELLKRIYEKERNAGNCSFCYVDMNDGKPRRGWQHERGCLFPVLEATVKVDRNIDAEIDILARLVRGVFDAAGKARLLLKVKQLTAAYMVLDKALKEAIKNYKRLRRRLK